MKPAAASAQPADGLRPAAERLAADLPPLLAEARHLALAVQFGLHGRRRAGQGDEFWQYRTAMAGDEARQIDWRRSARSDLHFVRQKELQSAQSVQFWADGAPSMAFRSADNLPEKRDRARLLALAAAILLERAGERIGLADGQMPPRAGQVQLDRMAAALIADEGAEGADFGLPSADWLVAGAHALFLSDFFGDPAVLSRVVGEAADKGVTGALVQVIDPAEAEFPFAGRAIFESMGGRLRHETREAAGLRDRYRARFAERQEMLADLALKSGWQLLVHATDGPAAPALLWLYAAIGMRT